MRSPLHTSLLFLAAATLGVPLLFAEPNTAQPQADRKVKTVAHLRLTGDLDEAPVADDPLFGGGAENFRAKLARLRQARDDKNVDAVYLELDGVSAGWAKLEELSAVIAELRKAGKKVFAFIEAGETKDYLVALAADEITVPPSGWLMLTGMRAEITFYKELLTRLGIRADMIWMGIYKFTGENYTRTSMSPEARKQFELVLGDFFAHNMVRPISQGRQRAGRKELSEERIRALIDKGPYTASGALQAQLVDRVAYASELEASFKSVLAADEVKIVRNYGQAKKEELDFSNPFNLFKLLSPSKSASSSKKDRIALVYACGSIVTGKGGASLLGGTSVGSTTLVEAIRQADSDPTVKAIVLRVDSPGGSALASDLIWRAVKECKKPVIASMSDVAASGGYYISMGTRKIFAQPGTLTGSIGVVGGKVALTGLYEKAGITTEVIQFGANAGVFSGSDGFSPSQRKAVEALMADTYEQFLSKAIEGRAGAGKKFTRAEFLKLAEGRIWTGRQAQERGLVDELGGLDDAIAEAKRQAGLGANADVDYLILPKARSFVDTLLDSKGLTTAPQLQQLLRLPELGRHLHTLDGLLQLRGEPVWLLMPHGLSMRRGPV